MFQNRKKRRLKQVICFLSGMLVALLISDFLNKPAMSTRILYVSQDELLKLEKNRLENQKEGVDKQLFYGKPKFAIKIIKEIACEYSTSTDKVVFSRGPVSGDDVHSISGEVYELLLNKIELEHTKIRGIDG